METEVNAVKGNAGQDVIYLASCAVNNRIPEQSRIETMDPDAVFAFASGHMISSVIAVALESAGYRDSNTGKAIASAIRRSNIFENAFAAVKEKLEEQDIWYMPLKGAVIKDCYPKPFMREFSDYDILFDHDRAEDVRNIMEGLGFSAKVYGLSNQDVYYKEPVLNFEMHKFLYDSEKEEDLYDNYKSICDYYEHVEGRLHGDGYEKSFSPEDFYIFMIAHAYKHYSKHGTGLRSLLDIYIYNTAKTLNMDYVYAETEKLGIREFEKQSRELAMSIFGEEAPEIINRQLLNYIMVSGAHGNNDNYIQNTIRQKKWTKTHYMMHRFRVPASRKNAEYKEFAYNYPTFYKHKILLPLLPFYRAVLAIKDGRMKKELKVVKRIR